MGNSKLVSHTRISPNKSSRNGVKIDTITIHCVVGQIGVESLGSIFAPSSRQASSNYGIGFDGRVGMYVEEKDRSWCTSSYANDRRAITIECASDMSHPYAINDRVMDTLIELCADIVRRNGMVRLKWQGDKRLIGNIAKQNMTVHRWFSNTACPGDYLYSRMGQIAIEVNKRLGESTSGIVGPTPTPGRPSTPNVHDDYAVAKDVIEGKWGNGDDRKIRLTRAGYNPIAVQKLVNEILMGEVAPPTKSKWKSNSIIADEVIAGQWGNGDVRLSRLTNAGYDPNTIQGLVNSKLGGVSKPKTKSISQIATEVIRGDWGNGDIRRNRLRKAGYNIQAVQREVNRRSR